MKRSMLFYLFIAIAFQSCTYQDIEVDLIVHNAKVYTVDQTFSTVEAFAVKDGKIIELGAERAILNKYSAKKIVNAENAFVYPGFIDAHCHFLYYGKGLNKVDLVGTTSWDEVLEKVGQYAKTKRHDFILGRGWDQNDWEIKEFPSNEKLSEMFPEIPVVLSRIDGHALLVNDAALRLANVQIGQEIEGGIIETKEGRLTGILVDNAENLVMNVLPVEDEQRNREALLNAQKNCFEVGLTTVDDAGLNRQQIELINRMHEEGDLKMRVYAMISDNKKDLDHYFSNGKLKTDRLNVRSIKVYADGALGSRGASLLEPYHDKPEEMGFLISSIAHYDSLASSCFEFGFQMNTHCIGDSANRLLTEVYGKCLQKENDLRWRIEHAQIVEESDIEKFSKYSIIPSIQPTHATSDMYWAEDRLGKHRMNEAYPYQSLLTANGMVALGTDFPVEKISPLLTYYAAVARKDVDGYPEESFLAEQKLSRKEALMGMTIWAAISNFEEDEKGSLEEGKFADFVILDSDLLKANEKQILEAKVLATFVDGEEVFRK